MGMEHWGVWGAGNGNHTVSPVIHTVDGASARIGRNLDTCKHGPKLIKLMGYEHRDDAVGGGGAGNVKHTHTHTVSTVLHKVDRASRKDRTHF